MSAALAVRLPNPARRRRCDPRARTSFPLAGPFLIVAIVALVFIFALIQIGAIEYAYERIGIRPGYVFTLLLLSLVGSYVNIPVAELREERVVSGREVTVFGVRYDDAEVDRAHRDQVGGDAAQVEEEEGAKQRERHGRGDHQRGTQVAHAEARDQLQHEEGDALQHVVAHRVQGALDELGAVAVGDDLYPGGDRCG